MPASSAASVARADLCAERTDEKVATARTRVPAAVAAEAAVETQSAICRVCHRGTPFDRNADASTAAKGHWAIHGGRGSGMTGDTDPAGAQERGPSRCLRNPKQPTSRQ